MTITSEGGRENASQQGKKAPGRLEVAVPEDTFEAGRIGTVRLIIRNPFDVPVEITSIDGPKSSHLREVRARRSEVLEKSAVAPAEGSGRIKSFFSGVARGITPVMISQISFGGLRAHFPRSSKTITIRAENDSVVRLDRDLAEYDELNIVAAESASVRVGAEAATDRREPDSATQRIGPHCEAVAHFYVETRRWLLFRPTRLGLSAQLTYSVDGDERTQVVSSTLDVKPPLRAMILGALLGAAMGALAKFFRQIGESDVQQLAITAAGGMVMSAIATIALARKRGEQGFITVEDFFGGFVVGVLITYAGAEYFERAIIPEAE